MELAADFRRKLDGPVELSELRAFWLYCDALDGGILFPLNLAKPLGQGYKEIIAVWSCLRAYLSLAAEDYKEKAGATDTAGRKGEVTAKTPGDKGLFPALVGVGSRSAVGAGLLAAGQQTQYVAILALGITNPGITILPPPPSLATGFPDDLRRELESRFQSSTTTTRTKLIVIRLARMQFLSNWLVDSSYECLVLKRTEVVDLAQGYHPVPIGSTFVLVELEPSESLESLAAMDVSVLLGPFPFLQWLI